MRTVSDSYLEAMYSSSVVQSIITGTITTELGTIYNLSDSDILQGSLSVNNKCVNNSSFEFGATYQGELSVTLINDSIDRYKLSNAAITFTEHRLLSDGSYEHISTGTFYVSEATRSKKTLTIRALDAMDWLDIDVEENTYGTVYQLLSLCAVKSGLTLAQTEEEILEMCNATAASTYYLYTEDVDTYRTLVSYLAIVTGTFAIINADNQLELRSYATEATQAIPAAKRNDTTISDFETYYSGITGRFIADTNYATYTYTDSSGSGLVLDIGDIPIVRGTTTFKHNLLETLYAKLQAIRYVPVSFTLLTSDLALELGDMLTIEGDEVSTLVTGLTWSYHASEQIQGVGDNPRLTATDKTTRQLDSLSNEVASKTLTTHTYTNAKKLSVSTSETEIVSIKTVATEDTTAVFIVTVPYSMDLDGLVTFKYYVDEVLDDTSTVDAYAARGANVTTLANYFPMTDGASFKLKVTMQTAYFDSDIRELTAKVTDTDVDETVPTASIAAYAVKAMLTAQGNPVTVETWDGTITVEEEVASVTLQSLAIAEISDSANVYVMPTQTGSAIETVTGLMLQGLPIGDITTAVGAALVFEQYVISTASAENYDYDSYYVTVGESFGLQTSYEFIGVSTELGEGWLTTISITTDSFASVEGITAGYQETCLYLMRSGDTLYTEEDGALVALEETEISSDLFDTYGLDALTSDLLITLDNPEILCYSVGDYPETVSAVLTAEPETQAIISNRLDLTDETITGIENVTANCEGDVLYAVKFDDGAWKAWSGTAWVDLSDATSGMTKKTMEELSVDEWNELYAGAEGLYVRAALSAEQTLTDITINFTN